MRELRCPGNKLHGMVEDDPKPHGIVEFRCDSKFCGKVPGNVVLHRFDLSTTEISTRRYLEPPTPTERSKDGSRQSNSSLRPT